MSRERFLLYMLVIFTFQAGVFGFGLYKCAENGVLQSCPNYENVTTILQRDGGNNASIINR